MVNNDDTNLFIGGPTMPRPVGPSTRFIREGEIPKFPENETEGGESYFSNWKADWKMLLKCFWSGLKEVATHMGVLILFVGVILLIGTLFKYYVPFRWFCGVTVLALLIVGIGAEKEGYL